MVKKKKNKKLFTIILNKYVSVIGQLYCSNGTKQSLIKIDYSGHALLTTYPIEFSRFRLQILHRCRMHLTTRVKNDFATKHSGFCDV